MPVFKTPDGVKLSFRMEGSGKTLLFLHGWSMCSRVWKYQLEWFSKDYQVVGLDLRGHGRSESPNGDYSFSTLSRDIVDFIEGMKIEKLTLVGWSLAVSLILGVCGSLPSCVDSIVLIGGTPAFIASEEFPHGLPSTMVKKMLKMVDSDFHRALKVFHDLLLSSQELEAENKDEIWDMLTNEHYLPRQEVASQSLLSFAHVDLRSKLKDVTVPTLIVHGKEDRICPAGAAQYMKEHIKDAQIIVFPEAGHAPFLTQADAFNQHLNGFLHTL